SVYGLFAAVHVWVPMLPPAMIVSARAAVARARTGRSTKTRRIAIPRIEPGAIVRSHEIDIPRPRDSRAGAASVGYGFARTMKRPLKERLADQFAEYGK